MRFIWYNIRLYLRPNFISGHPLNTNSRPCVILYHGAGDARDGDYHSEPCTTKWPGYACETNGKKAFDHYV